MIVFIAYTAVATETSTLPDCGCWAELIQGQPVGDTEIDELVKKFDKDSNSVFDKVGCRSDERPRIRCRVGGSMTQSRLQPCFVSTDEAHHILH